MRSMQLTDAAPPTAEGHTVNAVDKWLAVEKSLSHHQGCGIDARLKVMALRLIMVGRANAMF